MLNSEEPIIVEWLNKLILKVIRQTLKYATSYELKK